MLNFCRGALLEKKHQIKLEHVSSHKGTLTPEQQGNDVVDMIANEYRRQGEMKPPCLYFTESEEQYLLKHNKIHVQGDPRSYLKSLEQEQMLKSWKSSAPKQAKWFTRYPTQVLKHANNVWKWAIERGEGAAWIYFIFAVSQWLPTNHMGIIWIWSWKM